MYPTDYDASLKATAREFTKKLTYKTEDVYNPFYTMFRYGTSKGKMGTRIYPSSNQSFPLYNNSYYFYFGCKVTKKYLYINDLLVKVAFF